VLIEASFNQQDYAEKEAEEHCNNVRVLIEECFNQLDAGVFILENIYIFV